MIYKSDLLLNIFRKCFTLSNNKLTCFSSYTPMQRKSFKHSELICSMLFISAIFRSSINIGKPIWNNQSSSEMDRNSCFSLRFHFEKSIFTWNKQISYWSIRIILKKIFEILRSSTLQANGVYLNLWFTHLSGFTGKNWQPLKIEIKLNNGKRSVRVKFNWKSHLTFCFD